MIGAGNTTVFRVDDQSTLRFEDRICVPDEMRLKNIIMEAHEIVCVIHPGEINMYQNLNNYFWWHNMRREVAQFVAKCLVCQKVKADRHKTSGLLQPLDR
jgi:Integrase zinc binding domain